LCVTYPRQRGLKNSDVTVFEDKQKAIHSCIWENFVHRAIGTKFCVVAHPNNKWAVCKESFALDMEFIQEIISNDYTSLSYDEISHIRMDKNPLLAWEEIAGMFSIADVNILRFILHSKIPLEKLIRYELAARGHDKNINWVGFEKAKEIWLSEN